MGSGSLVVEEAVNYLVAQGQKVGGRGVAGSHTSSWRSLGEMGGRLVLG